MQKQKVAEPTGPQGNQGALRSDSKLKSLTEQAEALQTDAFMSAEELELNEQQRTALIMTLELIETGGISRDKFINGKKFSMSSWIAKDWFTGQDHKPHCGSVCCIGGTATLLAGGSLNNSIFIKDGLCAPTDALNNLFFRWGACNPTAEEAGQQLRIYLETGKCPVHWADWRRQDARG